MTEQCSAPVFSGGYHSHSCSRKGSVQRDGKWYCKQHDPVHIAERRAGREREWDAKSAADKKRWAEADKRKSRRDAYERAFDGADLEPEQIKVGMVKQMISVMEEAADLLDAAAEHNYEPDSFSSQPLRLLLAEIEK